MNHSLTTTNPFTDLPHIGAPARRALASIGVVDLAGVSSYSPKQLLALHGVGPKALRILKAALTENGHRCHEDWLQV